MSKVTLYYLSLLVLLPSSSFSLYSHLEEHIRNENVSIEVIKFSADKGLPSAIKAKLSLIEKGTTEWLNYIRKLALDNHEYSEQLAAYLQEQGDETGYLKWLVHAANLKSETAIFGLVKYFYMQNNFQQALYWLSKSKTETEQFLVVKIKVLLALGQVDAAINSLNDISLITLRNKLAVELKKYNIHGASRSQLSKTDLQSITLASVKKAVQGSQCLKSISMIATNLNDLDKMSVFKQRFSQHPFAQYICIEQVSYLPITDLDCQDNAFAAINCDEKLWREHTSKFPTDYLAVMLPQGGANVHYGILYIDRLDSFEVFTHELSHLLGFVDEYQVPNSHEVCQLPQEAKGHNIALIKKRLPKSNTDSYGSKSHLETREGIISLLPWGSLISPSQRILENKGSYWQVGTVSKSDDSFGLYLSETCQSELYAAFKPVKKSTSLRHTDASFPQEYMSILALSPDKFIMPMYYFNIAVSHYRAHQDRQGDIWLDKAQVF